MASIGRQLNDPVLVCKIQQFLGVIPVEVRQENGTKSQNGVAGHVNGEWAEAVANKLSRDHSIHEHGEGLASQVGEQNGFINNHQNGIRSRPAKKERITRKEQPRQRDRTPDSRGPSSERAAEQPYEIKYKILYYLFRFGASLGNEIFYITFFPCWFWNIDGYVGRRVCLFWCLLMYIGQATKDIVRWPRPASPPVIRLERFYELEFGMPSTHAMVGAGLPFSILYFTMNRYLYPWELGLVASIFWCLLVCVSRLYLGMHSVLDVLVGLVYVFALMPVVFPWLDTLDNFILTNPFSPLACIFVPYVMCWCYPTLEKFSTTRSDTTLVQGVGAGIALAHWASFQYGMMTRAPTPPPYNIIWPTWYWTGEVAVRFVIGCAMVGISRAILKPLFYSMICKVQGLNKRDWHTKQKQSVELPYKFFTYVFITLNSIIMAPLVFRYLGIHRETYFTEI